ncbi:hypothetical protein H206_03341 [Candidatus Electrothrix aarhusensis]|uniref:Lcl C-terminal domain-containing protein n=1 Tax=Candidatus Electrothrix aarhusensis TaxID=1859131 RepID=A0A3S3U7H0_9BACT|nr:hypothetical protein H206_03341 [Candidatus Electrothrix aarhusensis]
MLSQLKLNETTVVTIDWDMTPDLAFCTFSAKGLREELISTKERTCYFFIDNWGDAPKLCLMERGVRYVHILAEITAPKEIVLACIFRQGAKESTRENFPVDDILKEWLLAEVVDRESSPYLLLTIAQQPEVEDMGEPLPSAVDIGFSDEKFLLPSEPRTLTEEQVELIIRERSFYDVRLNPQGNFSGILADTGDELTVFDERTNLLWQRTGIDLCSIRTMKAKIDELNRTGFAGFDDWRMPSPEEAMSLLEPTINAKGMHLHPCFSKEQPFIFTNARRNPTGYWFVDYAQGKTYWSSGTVPGGFCRLCRKNE